MTSALLLRRGLPLAIAELTLDDRADVMDLDDARVLVRERLRPSHVATRDRATTQPMARTLYERHLRLAALRWWSTFEAQWMHFTVFDRAGKRLRVNSVRSLNVEDQAVQDAADFFVMRR